MEKEVKVAVGYSVTRQTGDREEEGRDGKEMEEGKGRQ